MKRLLILFAVVAGLGSAGCIVTGPDGLTYDCVGEPVPGPGGLVMTVHCYPVRAGIGRD